MPPKRSAMLLLPSLLLLFGCRDAVSPEHPPVAPPPETGAAKLTGAYECRVDAERLTLTCTLPGTGDESTALAILGQNQVQMASTNVVYDSATQILSADVTVQNLMGKAIGTPDGVDTTGIKVFFESGPTATSYVSAGDTGTVYMSNPDSTGNFTGADQPYYLYDTLLQPQEVSGVRQWHFHKPPQVKTFSFTVRAFAAMPGEPRVPMTSPDSTPAWFYEPQNSTACSGVVPADCLPNVAVVYFHSTSTQEERQAAIESIDGVLVGGGTGSYYVKLPADTTTGTLQAAMSGLARLPQVKGVYPYITTSVSPDYLIPSDGRAWRVRPDSADGDNWAQERVAAPFAWGCATGDPSTAVAVVDEGVFSVPDLDSVISHTYSLGYNGFSNKQHDHGTRVSGVITAHGRDSVGTTGIMWESSLRVYDLRHGGRRGTPADVFDQIKKAGRDGARVINVSVGWPHRDSNNVVINPDTVSDPVLQQQYRTLVESWYQGLATQVDSLSAGGFRPLIVMSAGNDGIDAKWNVARLAADSAAYQDQVLVVGASDIADSYAWFSNHGSLVEVAAPGDQVFVLHGDGVVDSMRANYPAGETHTGSGTSFAAPMVTGLAGLLFSFDPALTAGEVKQYIVDGAIRGGRNAAAVPIINAHESLRLAALRSGAPLCGNRVWEDGGDLLVSCDSTGTVFETVASGVGAAYGVNPIHGGRTIFYYPTSYFGGGGTLSRYTWKPSTRTWEWSDSLPFEEPGEVRAGSYNSAMQLSHDGDVKGSLRSSAIPGYTDVVLQDVATSDTTLVTRIPNMPRDTFTEAETCLQRRPDGEGGYDCTHIDFNLRTGGNDYSRAYTITPQADRFIVVESTHTYSLNLTGWYPCSSRDEDSIPQFTRDEECRDASYPVTYHGSSAYWIHTNDGHTEPISGFPQHGYVTGYVFSELGDEVLVSIHSLGGTKKQWIYRPEYSSVVVVGSYPGVPTSCRRVFLDLDGNKPDRYVPCSTGGYTPRNVGGFAPNETAAAGMS